MATMICIYCGIECADHLAACPACGMATTPLTKTLPAGTQLHAGKYAVGRVLGEGGFGITYQGAHRALRRPVAIKELFPEGAVRRGTRVTVSATQREDFQRERDRALQEAQVMAGFQSRHIVDVSDMFLENDTTYIVMEYLEGQTLASRIQTQGALPWEEVQGLALNLCEALEEVHGHQLLHRDLKPANVVLLRNGRTVLIDFGSARPFRTGQTVQHTRTLTPDYAAPEQYSRQARFGPCTDIFGLGATLYHALTGTPPAGALERMQGFAPATVTFPPGLSPPLCTALRQALELRVEDRPQTVAAFRSALRGIRADAPLVSGAEPRAAADRDAAADLVRQGNARLTQGQYQAAIADYDQALRRDPDAAIAYRHRGDAKAALGQYTGAIADYDQALQRDPDNAWAYWGRGSAKLTQGQYQAAIADYDQALQQDPNYANAYYNRGEAKLKLRQYREAIADYDQALRRNPNDARAYRHRGDAKRNLGQYAAARADYDRALRLNPDYDQALGQGNDAAAYNNRGVAKKKLGQYRAAIADYDQALQLDPDHAEAYLNRGYAKHNLGQYRAAIADYDQALQLNPDYAEAYLNRGYAKHNLGQYRAAIDDYDRALRRDLDDAAAFTAARYNRMQAIRMKDLEQANPPGTI